MRLPFASLLLPLVAAAPALAQTGDVPPPEVATASTLDLLGRADTSSQGSVTRQELQQRPVYRVGHGRAPAARYGALPPLPLIGAAVFTTCYLFISGHLQDRAAADGGDRRVRLIHGFGFAADLLESRLPLERLAEIWVGLNLGVDMGQLTVVLAVTGVVVAARRLRVATPRPIAVDVLAASLVAVGKFWLIGRSFA